MRTICKVLDSLSEQKWTVNQKVLDVIEHLWNIGGGLCMIPRRFNERTISPEMIFEANYREKLKLIKEH